MGSDSTHDVLFRLVIVDVLLRVLPLHLGASRDAVGGSAEPVRSSRDSPVQVQFPYSSPTLPLQFPYSPPMRKTIVSLVFLYGRKSVWRVFLFKRENSGKCGFPHRGSVGEV